MDQPAHEATLKKSIMRISILRMLVVLLTGMAIYFVYGHSKLVVLALALGLIVFFFLVKQFNKLQREKELTEVLIDLNNEELKLADRDFHHRKTGEEFQDPNHFYSYDIDLFGKGSFYQYLSRSATEEGALYLANALKANNIEDIPQRQVAIQELTQKAIWRQHFYAVASLVKVETPALKIIEWLKDYKPFIHSMMSWLPKVYSLISIILIVIAFLGIIPESVVVLWLILGLIITGAYLKKINQLSNDSDKLKYTFRQYSKLLSEIENETFASPLLLKKQQQIESEDKKASTIFQALSKHLDALDNRNNLLIAVFMNGFFLYDIVQTMKIEQWISEFAGKVNDWFQVVSFFDAYNSFGNFAFNHPHYSYPSIKETSAETKIQQLGHPLLDPSKRVDSDVSIKNQEFFIVTGANMAGKSTFLRTISLHIVMANIGLPVCAQSSEYDPVKLITSMRTSDSLTDDSSYFFSELTRLKFIVDAIEKERYFIVLDEILKGTNSTDKAIGSKKFVEKLVASDATGIIATHDLSLCEIADSLDEVKNYYFDAEIIDDELFFDYRFKEGICQNMNASFLLKKMNIV